MRTVETMDGQTDITKIIVAFPNFANAPKNQTLAYAKHEEHIHMIEVPYTHTLHAVYTQILGLQ